MDLITIIFNNDEYVSCAKILELAPIFSKGSKTTRTLIKNKGIADDMFIYAKLGDDGNWIITSGSSIKYDKVFIKKEYLINIPELQENKDDVIIVDDKGIKKAPKIINLTDEEKFKDTDGNIIEIEARGERNCNGIYFRVKNVELGLDLKQLSVMLGNKNTTYEKDVDYCFFNCYLEDKNNKKYIKKNNKKETVKKEMFLTYEGILKVIFSSRSGKTKGFKEWMKKTLFTVQMGTKKQKDTLAAGLIGMSMDELKTALNACSSTVSCIYRFCIGTAGELREIMSIPDHIPDDHLIIKYGFTKDLSDRMIKHIKTFKKIKGSRLELMNYVFIDPKFLSKAEVDIKDFFMTMEKKVEYKIEYLIKDKSKIKAKVQPKDNAKEEEEIDDYDESKVLRELVAIDPKHETQIVKQYKYIGLQYSGRVKALGDTINELQQDVLREREKRENVEKICKMELEKERERGENIEKICKLELEKKEEQFKTKEEQFKTKEEQFKTKEEQFKNQLLIKEIEYLKLSLQIKK